MFVRAPLAHNVNHIVSIIISVIQFFNYTIIIA